jgi:uncharacterized protein YndB with AHSA1/START domain
MVQVQSTQELIAPVVKTVKINLPVNAAFRLFTEDVNRWWPLATHSVFGDEAVSCTLEGRVGGRFYEMHRDGRQSEWGQVLVWEPPHRVVFTMHPGRTRDTAQEVEVTFQGEARGTRVTLTHRGWENLGEQAKVMRGRYDHGWEGVLEKYTEMGSSYGRGGRSPDAPKRHVSSCVARR